MVADPSETGADMLAIVIPAHNEAAHIGACVAAARRAADHH